MILAKKDVFRRSPAPKKPVGVVEAAGSNPVTQTSKRTMPCGMVLLLFCAAGLSHMWLKEWRQQGHQFECLPNTAILWDLYEVQVRQVIKSCHSDRVRVPVLFILSVP